jgi:hypothetical protein
MGMGGELLKKAVEVLEYMRKMDTNERAIEILVNRLEDMLREKGIYLPVTSVQLVNVTHSKDGDGESVIIDIYLNTVELWVKITKDYVSTYVYPLVRCEC